MVSTAHGWTVVDLFFAQKAVFIDISNALSALVDLPIFANLWPFVVAYTRGWMLTNMTLNIFTVACAVLLLVLLGTHCL